MVDLLLSKGADVNAKSKKGSLRSVTIYCGMLTLRRLEWPSASTAKSLGAPPLTSVDQTALHFCASKNQLDLARKLIDRKATTRVKDKRGQLPLHRAASIGSVPMVQLLLEHSSPLNATDVSGMTALHHGRHPQTPNE